jgi:hypothetical protein
MRAFGLAVAFLMAWAVPAQAQQAELDALVKANSWPVAAGEAGLTGPGGEQIAGWARDVPFFLLGENHGSAGMARFATALSQTLAGSGYRYTAIEVDPLMTDRLTALMRQGGKPALAAWLGADKNARAIPFFFWSEEADFIESALRRGPLWGLDQSFVAAAHVHLDTIAERSRSPEVQAMARQLAGEARADLLGFMGKVQLARLEALRDAAARAEPGSDAANFSQQLLESAQIYAPFMGRGGSVYAANLKRETLMKRLFQTRLDVAMRVGEDANPKVLFKFGANHLARGLSSTHVPSLGNFVSDMALARFGKPVVNLTMVCGPGAQLIDFASKVHGCGEDFAPLAPLKSYLASSGDTLFDLRPLRDRPRLWKDWPKELQELVWSYDAVVVIAGGGPSTYLAPMPK